MLNGDVYPVRIHHLYCYSSIDRIQIRLQVTALARDTYGSALSNDTNAVFFVAIDVSCHNPLVLCNLSVINDVTYMNGSWLSEVSITL